MVGIIDIESTWEKTKLRIVKEMVVKERQKVCLEPMVDKDREW